MFFEFTGIQNNVTTLLGDSYAFSTKNDDGHHIIIIKDIFGSTIQINLTEQLSIENCSDSYNEDLYRVTSDKFGNSKFQRYSLILNGYVSDEYVYLIIRPKFQISTKSSVVFGCIFHRSTQKFKFAGLKCDTDTSMIGSCCHVNNILYYIVGDNEVDPTIKILTLEHTSDLNSITFKLQNILPANFSDTVTQHYRDITTNLLGASSQNFVPVCKLIGSRRPAIIRDIKDNQLKL